MTKLLLSIKSSLIWLFIILLKTTQHRRVKPFDRARFLVPAYTGLGNFIMMTPIITALRKLYPSCHIHIIAGNNFGTEFVLEGTGTVDNTWILREDSTSIEKLWFFWKLRREHIDITFIPFDASPSFYWLGVMIAGIPRRIGHTSEILRIQMGWTRKVLTDAVPVRANRHETDLHLDLLEIINPCVERSYTTIVTTSDHEQVLKRFGLTVEGYIVVQVSAANGTASPKVWPLSGFHLLMERLYREGFIIVLAGDKMEKNIVDRFAEECSVPVINLAGRTSVQEVASVIKNAAALVCHDSGLMHIGNALQTPLVALYGPTDYVYTRPMAETSMIIRKDLPCAPCMANFAKTEGEAYNDCPINFECMKRIAVAEVFEAVLRQVSARKKTTTVS